MGREVKRVPLGFDWPLEKVWTGFLNPHYRPCPSCKAGYSAAYDAVSPHVGALLWQRTADAHVIAITTFLAGRQPRAGVFGHDSIDQYSAVKRIGSLAGLPDDWYLCSTCKGAAVDLAVKDAYEAWEPSGPPSGEGWQVWETVSEGSPVSPVFAERADLVAWLVGKGYSREAADNFSQSGWAPSMVIAGGEVLRDIESARTFRDEA